MRRARVLAVAALASSAACAHAPWADQGPRPCRETWAELGVDGRYDHPRDARVGPNGNDGYAAYRARTLRKTCTKRWTVLVHVDATGLEAEAIAELARLEAPAAELWRSGASTFDADVVAELVFAEGTRRLHLFRAPDGRRAATRAAELASPIVETFTSTKSEADRIEDFLRWGVAEHPADDYAVFVWGRGVVRPVRSSTRTPQLDAPLASVATSTAPPELARAEGSTSTAARADLSDRTGVPPYRFVDDAPPATLEARALGRALTRAASAVNAEKRWSLVIVRGPAVMSVDTLAAVSPSARFVVGAEHVGPGLAIPYRAVVERVNGTTRDALEGRALAASIPQLVREGVADGPRAGTPAEAHYTSTAVDGAAVEAELVPAILTLGRALEAYVAEDELRKIDLAWLAGPAGAPELAPGLRDLGVFLARLEELVERERSNAPSPATDALTAAITAVRATTARVIVERRFGAGHDPATAGLSITVPADRAALDAARTPTRGTTLEPWLRWLDAVL